MADKLIQSTSYSNLTLDVYHGESIVVSKCYSKFLRGMADNLDKDLIIIGKPWFDNNCGVIYLVHQGAIIGYLAYSDEKKEILYIVDMNVDKEFAHKDVYKILLTAMEDLAKTGNFLAVSATLYAENTEAIQAAEEIGLVGIYKQLFKKL